MYDTLTAAADAGWVIPTAAVTDTYRGRPGCACGCLGTYSTHSRAVNHRVGIVNRNLRSFRISERTVQTDTTPRREAFVYGDVDGITYTIYLHRHAVPVTI
jgi:hypothetical protein